MKPENYTSERYINDRLKDQIDWYGKKAGTNKLRYYFFATIELSCAALIPFMTGIIPDNDNEFMRLIVGLLGVIVVVAAGICNLFKFKENWTNYRSTSETLKHEKYLFLTSSSPYSDQNLKLLSARVEALISTENTGWKQIHIEPGENNDK